MTNHPLEPPPVQNTSEPAGAPRDTPRDVPLRGDRPFTIRMTALCLLIGVAVAVPLGAALYSLNRPLTSVNGQLSWSFGAFAFPLALIVSGGVLTWSVFVLPVTLSRRAGRLLDPQIWPMAGVLALAGALTLAFGLAIIFQVI